jgi:hypothetical protein
MKPPDGPTLRQSGASSATEPADQWRFIPIAPPVCDLGLKIPGKLQGKARERAESAKARLEADPDGFIDEYLTQFGYEMNADNASELFPEYSESAESRTCFHSAIHQMTRWVRDAVFVRALADPSINLIVFTGGGSGSGKSTAFASSPPDPSIAVYDTTLSMYDGAKQEIDKALRAGKDVLVKYLYRDPVEAYEDGVLPRAMGLGQGRTVSVTSQVRTHLGAQDAAVRLAGEYAGNEHVCIEMLRFEHRRLTQIAPVRRIYDGIEERLNEALQQAYSAGRISRTVYESSRTAAREEPRDH